jgi:zinc protease
VRSNVTQEAAMLIRDLVRDYGATFTPADLELTRGSLTRSRARSFETSAAKLGMLENIGDYGLPADYLQRETAVLENLTLEQVQALARRHIDTGRMILVAVGDAKTQAARLEALGYGAPVMVPPLAGPARYRAGRAGAVRAVVAAQAAVWSSAPRVAWSKAATMAPTRFSAAGWRTV